MPTIDVSSGSEGLSSGQPMSVKWDRTASERLAATQDVLRGTGGALTELRDLAFALKDVDKRFTHARRLLLRVRRHDDFKELEFPKRRKILQQLALCTDKDDDLPAERWLDRALKWLKEIAPLEQLDDQESLCLTGAIYKRQWESTGQIACLKESLKFYQRGHAAAAPTMPQYDARSRSSRSAWRFCTCSLPSPLEWAGLMLRQWD
jgi:hypothetical protein